MPTALYLEANSTFREMFAGENFQIIIFLFMLAAIVIYSLMVSDVDEQTYQFAMMRALGFGKDHLVVFIVLQAFSFAVPGLVLGLLLALLLADAFMEAFYVSTHYAGGYGLSASSVALATVMLGFVIPVLSNIGPTK